MDKNVDEFALAMAKYLDKLIKEKFKNEKLGFFLSIFEIGKGSENVYVSNTQREGLAEALREIANHLEKDSVDDIKTIGNA